MQYTSTLMVPRLEGMVDINRYLRVHSRRTLYLMNLAVRALARRQRDFRRLLFCARFGLGCGLRRLTRRARQQRPRTELEREAAPHDVATRWRGLLTLPLPGMFDPRTAAAALVGRHP
jgi:hypothetical protein